MAERSIDRRGAQRAAARPVREPARAVTGGCAAQPVRWRGAGAADRRLTSAWIRAMSPLAVGTPLPELTDSRMRASSSSAVCARPKARSSAATTPLSICMNSVSSSWLRSPMGMRPAMRAPPLSVCSGRLSATRPSTLLRFSFHCASAPCAASMSSTASSVKMLAMSWSKSVRTSSTTSAAGGAAARCCWTAGGKEAGGAATAGATETGRGDGAGAVRRPARRRGRPRRCAVRGFRWPARCAPAARRATGRSRWTHRDATPLTAWRSCSRRAASRSAASRPTPLSNDLRTQCSSGAVRRMPWRASAMRELPDERVAGAIGLFADDVRRAARALALDVARALRRC